MINKLFKIESTVNTLRKYTKLSLIFYYADTILSIQQREYNVFLRGYFGSNPSILKISLNIFLTSPTMQALNLKIKSKIIDF